MCSLLSSNNTSSDVPYPTALLHGMFELPVALSSFDRHVKAKYFVRCEKDFTRNDMKTSFKAPAMFAVFISVSHMK